MVEALAIAFLAVGALLVLAEGLALVRIGLLRLESPLGIIRDGLPGGSDAPRWQLPDTDGVTRRVPSGTWQVLVFADHSLREFPELAGALTALRDEDPSVEVLVLPKAHPDLAAEVARGLGLHAPVVAVGDELYWRHNVRVMPFVMILDERGIVRAEGLTSDAPRFEMVWRRARFEAASAAAPARGGQAAGAVP